MMKIIKLGGSLYGASELEAWLNSLAELAQQETIIIVPGGGPFADQVRFAQAAYAFSDKQAHQMAILAMAQFGLLLTALSMQCQPFSLASNADLTKNGLWVWLPDQSIFTVAGIAESWDISADSMALWLAQQLNAEELVLVKRQRLASRTINDWCQQRLIDKGFQALYARQPLPVYAVHYQDYLTLPTSRIGLS